MSAAKKFKLKPMLGLAIGAAMCYPAIQQSALSAAGEPLYNILSGTMFSSPVYIDFFGIPIISVDYTGTVIPVYINNVMTLGYDNVMMPFFACTFATSAVVLAILKKHKSLQHARVWPMPTELCSTLFSIFKGNRIPLYLMTIQQVLWLLQLL